MDIRIIKKDSVAVIGYVPNVKEMIELPSRRMRIIGGIPCDGCGHVEEIVYDTDTEDTIMVLPRLD